MTMKANDSRDYRRGRKVGVKVGYKKGREDARAHLITFAQDFVNGIQRDINKRSGISVMLWNDEAEREKILTSWLTISTELLSQILELDDRQEKG